MNDFYHLCITAHSEVLLRSADDIRDITNLVALSAFRSGTQILTDAIMSNHMHFIILSENPGKFALSLRISITKHFNAKHLRSNRLFDRKVFICKLEGARHILMAINYVLKNPVHHGQTTTPFSYPCSTANYLFSTERGVRNMPADFERPVHASELSFSYLPKNAKLPDCIRMEPDGTACRSTFEEIKLVESFYFTSSSFVYNMNRRTSDEWIKEQEQDKVQLPAITLELIERGVNLNSIGEMMKNESEIRKRREFRTDMEVCQIVDNEILGRYRAPSIYCISIKQRLQIAMTLVKEPDITLQTAARATAIPIQLLQKEYNALYDGKHK